ncbi:MAG: transposase [Bacilli bacterium]|nr:transposase [Bacilli bacterium]
MRKSTGNAIYDIQYHFVWIPKYRQRVLIGTVKDRLSQLFSQCADIWLF